MLRTAALIVALVAADEPTTYTVSPGSLAKRASEANAVFAEKSLRDSLGREVYEQIVFVRYRGWIVVRAVPTGRYPPRLDTLAVIGADHKDFGPLCRTLDKFHK